MTIQFVSGKIFHSEYSSTIPLVHKSTLSRSFENPPSSSLSFCWINLHYVHGLDSEPETWEIMV